MSGNDIRNKIMVVDDEQIFLNIMSAILEKEYHLILVNNSGQVMDKAITHTPDLILLDIMMPEINGFEVISALKSNEMTKDIPVMFVSSLCDVEDEEKGLQFGAVDYITKPFNAAIVRARIKTHIKMAEQRKLLERIALLDCLTEIPNRRSYLDKLSSEWETSLLNKTLLSLIILDVDYFKEYNDNYGHGMGDVALKQIAGTLSNTINRDSDLVARIGGEEFAVLLPETGTEDAHSLAERMRKNIENMQLPHQYSKVSDILTISAGGTTLIPDINTPEHKLFEKADQALYEAKKNGRNRVVWG